jgi:multicomponent Na+:H+ antiporter subunit C
VTAVPGFVPYLLGGYLFLIGLYGVITSRNLIQQTICLSVVQTSTYVVILAVGYRSGAAAPIFYDIPSTFPAVDPVVAALTLTDVVVEATVTSVLLAIAVQAQKRFHSLDPEELTPLKG